MDPLLLDVGKIVGPTGSIILMGWFIWLKNKKWDGKKERRGECGEMPRLYKIDERLAILELKEKERNMELQELKKSVEKKFENVQSDLKDGFKETRDTLGRIFDRIETLKTGGG